MVREILAWEPEGSNLLARVDSSGRTALHLAVLYCEVAAVELLLTVETSLARISDNDGLFPLHAAAMSGCRRIIDVFIEKIPDCCEIVDGQGRNFLHCAVENNRERLIRHICRNDKLTSLLNATDAEGNTPLHLAVRYGHPRVVSVLLQTMSVETGIVNNDGLTARDVAYMKLEPGLRNFLVILPTHRLSSYPLTVKQCPWLQTVG
jgi:ankyrin repeat protein